MAPNTPTELALFLICLILAVGFCTGVFLLVAIANAVGEIAEVFKWLKAKELEGETKK